MAWQKEREIDGVPSKEQAWRIFGIIGLLVVILIAWLAIAPLYNVWARELRGKAELKQAEWNRQIKIEEANAILESSRLLKEADIIRAEGVAEANIIIAQSLTEEYIRWKWVEGLHDGSSELVYVPTEAGIPIMEATRYG